MKKLKELKYFFWAALFAVSMGFFEAAVVVDLRKIFNIGGSLFPLNLDVEMCGVIEMWREFFSIVMLVSVAAILSRGKKTGVAWFCYLFGIWDILYYVFLKILIGWPESLMTWDILFLLPVPWVSPVLAPIFASLTLISIAVVTIHIYESDKKINHPRILFTAELFAALIMIISFCWQWRDIAAGGVPKNFPWIIFAVSEFLMLGIFLLFTIPTFRESKND